MEAINFSNLDTNLLIRLFISSLLGFLIGFERKMRFKEAGIRTHSIVSLGSCLLTLISLYGFGGASDAARIAAQIVSGIGFLGAGMIMFKKDSGMNGLTTAAGIWTTAGIGMAVGCGLYYLAYVATALIITLQIVLHLPINILKRKRYYQLKIVFAGKEAEYEKVRGLFGLSEFSKLSCVKHDDGILYILSVSTDKYFNDRFIENAMLENSFIHSIERTDDF